MVDSSPLIKSLLRTALRSKFEKYKPESTHMPFHFALLGKDRMALYSFLQSLNTTFGTSIFEPVAEAIAKTRFVKVEKQYTVGDEVFETAQAEAHKIVDEIGMTGEPNKKEEIARLIAKLSGAKKKIKPVKVDLYCEDANGNVFLFDLKTAKPNTGEFKGYKRTLLEWCAVELTRNPKAKVHSLIAIPYNPYFPQPYQRWTMKGMLDLQDELKVAEEFWDFLGGAGTYEALLQCFEKVGVEMREEIDLYFGKFQK